LSSAIGGSLVCHERLMVVPQCLQDCCTLVLGGGILRRNPSGVIKVVKRLLKTMEHRASPCARHVGCGVGVGMAAQAIRQLRCPLVVTDTPEDEPAKNQQGDQACGFP